VALAQRSTFKTLSTPAAVYALALIHHSNHGVRRPASMLTWRHHDDLIVPAVRRAFRYRPIREARSRYSPNPYRCLIGPGFIAAARCMGWPIAGPARVPPYVLEDRELFRFYLAAAIDIEVKAALEPRRCIMWLSRQDKNAVLYDLETGCLRHGIPAITLYKSARHETRLVFAGRQGIEALLSLPTKRKAQRAYMERALGWAPTSPMSDVLLELSRDLRESLGHDADRAVAL
jgi:hypothetical protein